MQNVRAHDVFQGKRKLLKYPECKNFRAHSIFLGKHKLLKNPECEKYIQEWKISGQAQVAKKSSTVKKFNTAYIHLGVIRVIWASVLCNLDQSREWL